MVAPSEHKVDRIGWPSGAWDVEPDYLSWKTRAGLPAIIVRTRLGNLCGYVGVTREHPAYGKHYGTDEFRDVTVHGGLTYSEKCQGAICHVPAPGESDDVWWLGFDCAHAGDDSPGIIALETRLRSPHFGPLGTYKDVAYVRGECEGLAEQIAALRGAP